MGIITIYTASNLDSGIQNSVSTKIATSYYSISLALSVLLTLMIVARLLWHSKNIRNVMGAAAGSAVGGFYNTVVAMVVESSALYALSFIPFIVTFNIASPGQNVLSQILSGTQVRIVLNDTV